jgi:hypothetical protein
MLGCEPNLDWDLCFCTKEFLSGAISTDSERKLVSRKHLGKLLSLFCFKSAEVSTSYQEGDGMKEKHQGQENKAIRLMNSSHILVFTEIWINKY